VIGSLLQSDGNLLVLPINLTTPSLRLQQTGLHLVRYGAFSPIKAGIIDSQPVYASFIARFLPMVMQMEGWDRFFS
ncbi:hypothetical protein GN958_ATG04321, partial [Phytophthora infestans]